MYLRYRANYFNNQSNKIELGFFWATDYLINHGNLSAEHRKKLDDLIYWFDNKLPIPKYYQKEKNRQISKSATSWFKDSASELISKMNELTNILEKNRIDVSRISSKKLLGKIIYEDEFQVTVIPFREVLKRVK